MKLKRFFKRVNEEISATREIAKKTSCFEALNTFIAKIDIQRLVRNGYKESKGTKKRLLKKHSTMIKYFENTFGDYLSNYEFKKDIPSGNPEYSNNIWICWWQGLENAPDIVKACVKSIMRNCGNHKVVIITEKNYKDYIEIPEFIEYKVKEGIITRTNFSDLLRFSLLAKHGGLWLDSTFFCISDISKCFEEEIWTIKRPDYLHCSVACGMFAGYSLYCNYDNRWIFNAARDLFIKYWENNNKLIDYLLVDYMIVLVLEHSSEAKEIFDNIKPNNPKCDELIKIINNEFNEKKWEEITSNTDLFKLSWKQKFNENDNTYYSLIINDKL